MKSHEPRWISATGFVFGGVAKSPSSQPELEPPTGGRTKSFVGTTVAFVSVADPE